MTDLGYSKMHQLYGAMSVCGKTIEWLKQQELEKAVSELHYARSTVAHGLREAVSGLSGRRLNSRRRSKH